MSKEHISPLDIINAEPTLPPSLKEDIDVTSLTPEQEIIILKEWNSRPKNPPSLKELVQLAFGSQYDGRDKRARIVKSFLANRKIEARPSNVYVGKEPIILTEEQKQFIANNAGTMNCREMAEMLFDKKGLSALSQESVVVSNYIKTLDNRVKLVVEPENEKEVTEVYAAPKIESTMINKINKYIDEPIDVRLYSQNDKQKRWVKALIAYVNSYRFSQQIGTYRTDADRKLFESSFISYTYAKDDLTPEERD